MDAIFYIGVVSEEAPTATDALIYADLDWEVIQQDVYTGGGNLIPGYKANIYKSPVELWLDKTGQIAPQEAGEAAYWGTQLEPFVRRFTIKAAG